MENLWPYKTRRSTWKKLNTTKLESVWSLDHVNSVTQRGLTAVFCRCYMYIRSLINALLYFFIIKEALLVFLSETDALSFCVFRHEKNMQGQCLDERCK